MKYLALMLVGILLCSFTCRYETPITLLTDDIQWLSMEEALVLAQEDRKKILINFKTEWCKPCLLMEKQTFSDPQIAKYINLHFHPVKFDAEKNEDTFSVGGQLFRRKPEEGRNGLHEWTLELLGPTPAYPSTTFLNPDAELITTLVGHQKPKDMILKLKFLAENAYLKQDFDQYKKEFKRK